MSAIPSSRCLLPRRTKESQKPTIEDEVSSAMQRGHDFITASVLGIERIYK
jgi:hypothetical protein